MQKKRQKSQRGFTLIELVSVVIILGILAAVIVPKYMSMTGKAQDGAYKGALSEGMARLNMAYAQYIMQNGSNPTSVTDLTAASALNATEDMGDYSVKYSAGTKATTITLYKSTDTGTALKFSNNSDATLSVPWPQ